MTFAIAGKADVTFVLSVSEARDLGETNRFAFYDHLKAYTAAPPDVLRVDEKKPA